MGSIVSSGTGSATSGAGTYPTPYLEPTGQLLTEYLVGELQQPGLGGYADYLGQIQQQDLLSPAGYQSYMSPFQTEVIGATQNLLDEQRASGRQRLADTAVRSGAFGGSREGVQRAEYERQRDLYDAGLMSNLRQTGLGQAQRLQQQALGNYLGMSNLALQRLGSASNIFGGIARAVPTTTYGPLLTSPALEAAQAFGGVYGALGGGAASRIAAIEKALKDANIKV